MSDVPSPIEVTSWPQVAALLILAAAFVIIPAVLNYLSSRPIKKTLTQNNGGSSVKDYLDRIEARLDRIEGTTTTTDDEDYSDAPNP